MTLLNVSHLGVSFYSKGKKATKAINDIHFTVNKGETVALIGESGSGKSVTSLAIMDLLPENGRVDSGKVLFNDQNLHDLSKKEIQNIRGKQISMIFQDAMVSLNPTIKIGKQIADILRFHSIVEKRQLTQEVLRLLSIVGFLNPLDVYHQYPGKLSGGMKQRALIAMAISCKPALIIADEPTTALDVTIQKQILDLLNEYKEQTNTSILLITHDFGIVAENADRVIVMYNGEIVESADVFTLFNNPIHSYTKGLMNSIPKIKEPKAFLTTIRDSEMENQYYGGRQFAPNRFISHVEYDQRESRLIEVDPGHFVRFFTN
ncbi:ABC transporter ATP-binding protein [Pseudalkalibacillus berkeleyi]|uniref:ABC transporter ATP-binding protein n=1 Tax=Pseudalkalibacillus berkeleyi TaxID=1069813 RepID=A0ABS9H4L4_9BACL|nr:ABC transporter ATP-binding protein [Pseudalkalibacillus berkeleyi]MCF6138625.1 ABC transporter ATP-binding protein [Pseudalkalibacillus berkeleyi]